MPRDPRTPREAVEYQLDWIESCGGTLRGYRRKYGDPDLDKCSGNGGTAIFEADVAELARLYDRLC